MSDRRAQILDAALDLMADRALHEVSTRAIARRVGFSQPALFRHFRNRRALLQALVQHVRGQLAARAEALVATSSGLELARGLARALVEQARARPGTLTLLFEALTVDDPALQAAVRSLVDTWRTLAATAVEGAIAQGQVSAEVDPEQAGRLLVAVQQGSLLQWRIDGRRGDPSVEAALAAWEAALVAGQPRRGREPGAATSEGATEGGPREAAPGPGGAADLVLLDVRPILAAGRDPLQDILQAVERLADDGLLLVVAPFRPGPLIALLARRGHAVEAEPAGDLWVVSVPGRGAGPVEDLRELEAPGPMERVLARAEALGPGELALFRTPHVPHPALAELGRRGLAAQAVEHPAGGAVLAVRRPAPRRPGVQG